MTTTATRYDGREAMRAEGLRRRRAYEQLEARGLVASKIERYPTDIRVILRVPDGDSPVASIVEVLLAYDPHYPTRVVSGWVRFYDPQLGRQVDLDGTVRAEAWLRKAEATPVRETSNRGGFVTEYLDWR